MKKMNQHWKSPTNAKQESFAKRHDSDLKNHPAILLGIPDDRGTMNVGGRIGAHLSPTAIRQMLGQFMLGIDGAISKIELSEGININPGASIEEGHRALRHLVKKNLLESITPIVLGGSHDYGFPHVAGAFDAFKGEIALINIDAHLDVRPPNENGITSGSPFYLALEQGVVKAQNFTEFCIQEQCNDLEFYQYLRNKNVQIIELSQARQMNGKIVGAFKKLLRQYESKGLKTVVSFDIDAVQMAHAPGVSAPQSDGLVPEELFQLAKLSGQCASVVTVGFFEFNPLLDSEQKTARLVATAIHRYLTGLSQQNGGVQMTFFQKLRQCLPGL